MTLCGVFFWVWRHMGIKRKCWGGIWENRKVRGAGGENFKIGCNQCLVGGIFFEISKIERRTKTHSCSAVASQPFAHELLNSSYSTWQCGLLPRVGIRSLFLKNRYGQFLVGRLLGQIMYTSTSYFSFFS